MPINEYRPVTNWRRLMTVATGDDIRKQPPEKSLVEGKPKTGGRNSLGRISSRFRGGGAKRAYRIVDFKRDKHGIPAPVAAIEYDPNRPPRPPGGGSMLVALEIDDSISALGAH